MIGFSRAVESKKERAFTLLAKDEAVPAMDQHGHGDAARVSLLDRCTEGSKDYCISVILQHSKDLCLEEQIDSSRTNSLKSKRISNM